MASEKITKIVDEVAELSVLELSELVKEVEEIGVLGVFTGGIKATAAGIAAAIIFGYIASIVSKPQIKE